MRVTERTVESKFKALLQRGQQLLSLHGWNGREFNTSVPDEDYQQFRCETANLISRVCGAKSVHHQEMVKFAENERTRLNSFYFPNIFGILKGAYQDFEDGLLFDIRRLAHAGLLDDFLSQADVLAEHGYLQPAASLTGAVLEDTLRQLCEKHDVKYQPKKGIEHINVELARAEIYDKLIQKRITAEADLRNKADHGEFEKVNKDDVDDMIRWVRRFVSEHLN